MRVAPVLLSMVLCLPAAAQELRVHFVDAGQGNCFLVECPDGNNILVDCGSLNTCSRDSTTDYVLEQLGGSLDTLIITHPDQDHYSLLPVILDSVTPNRVMRVDSFGTNEYSQCDFDDDLTSQAIANVTTLLDANDHDPEGTPNSSINCGNANVWVLAADVQASASAKNAASIVLAISFNNFDIILTGDATEDTEDVILSRYSDSFLRAEVYSIPHHGSSTTSPDQELGVKAQPRTAILSSTGGNNNFGHPRKAAIKKMWNFYGTVNSHGIRWCKGQRSCRNKTTTKDVWTTNRSGTIVVVSDGNDYWIETVEKRNAN